MREFPSNITDPTYMVTKLSAIDRYFVQFIRDERDLPFIYLCFKIGFTITPIGLLLFTNYLKGSLWYIAAIIDLLLISLVFLGPYTLMLHLTSHRRFFKSEYSYFNKFIPWIIGPFMGQTPESYYSHHIGMHHPENNLRKDGSSTMSYQRDNWFHFTIYFTHFMLLGVYELIKYLKNEKKDTIRRHLIIGELWSYTFLIVMSMINFRSTLFVFILPYFIIRFGMMSGNWAQHAFISQEEPSNCYLNSITCINTVYNQLCFNDGYHIGHHLHPTKHWTDMPNDFIMNKESYAKNNAIVFEGLDYFIIWFFLMNKRYDWLASYYVNINNKYKTDDEVIDFLKSRTKQFITM